MVWVNNVISLFLLYNSANIIYLRENALIVLNFVLAYHLEEHFDTHSQVALVALPVLLHFERLTRLDILGMRIVVVMPQAEVELDLKQIANVAQVAPFARDIDRCISWLQTNLIPLFRDVFVI
jgi:hypothetical protein